MKNEFVNGFIYCFTNNKNDKIHHEKMRNDLEYRKMVCDKISESRKGIPGPKHTEEHKNHMSIIMKEKWERGEIEITDEMRKNWIRGGEQLTELNHLKRGVPKDEEHKRKIGDGNRGKHRDEIAKKKISDANIERFSDEEERRKQSERLKKYFEENPDKRSAATSYIDSNGKIYVSLNRLEEETGTSLYLLKRDYIDKDIILPSIGAKIFTQNKHNRPKPPNKVDITEEMKVEIKRLRMEEKMTKTKIGERLGISEAVVYRVCRELNLPSFRVSQVDFSNLTFSKNHRKT